MTPPHLQQHEPDTIIQFRQASFARMSAPGQALASCFTVAYARGVQFARERDLLIRKALNFRNEARIGKAVHYAGVTVRFAVVRTVMSGAPEWQVHHGGTEDTEKNEINPVVLI